MSENNTTSSALLDGIKSNARVAVIVGIILLICGVLAIGSPMVAGASITIMVGVMLMIGGVSQCFLAFQAGAFGRGLLIFVVGALTAVVGYYLFSQPIAGLASITLFLAAYFIVTGIVETIAGIQMRPADGSGLMLFNGIVTVVLGALIWKQFPVSGAWAVGVLFGIKLALGGLTLIFLGRGVRSAANDVAS